MPRGEVRDQTTRWGKLSGAGTEAPPVRDILKIKKASKLAACAVGRQDLLTFYYALVAPPSQK